MFRYVYIIVIEPLETRSDGNIANMSALNAKIKDSIERHYADYHHYKEGISFIRTGDGIKEVAEKIGLGREADPNGFVMKVPTCHLTGHATEDFLEWLGGEVK